MVRVPSYATNMAMIDRTMANKAQLDLYSYQTITGLKHYDYAGYGMSASSIVSFEAALGVNVNYMENNKILQTEVDVIETSIKAIDSSISDFKSMLLSFSGVSGETIMPDQTGGELKFTDTDMTVYQDQTITANGVEWTIGGTGANAIAIGTTPQELMENVATAIGGEYNLNTETIEFPLYTINGYSSVLNANGVETGEAHIPTDEQQQMIDELQTFAFATMKLMADTLNTSANGKYLFGGGNETSPPVDFSFDTLEDFQAYYDGLNITYPTSSAATLSDRELTNVETGGLTFDYAGGMSNTATITSANAGGFLQDNVSANAMTSGDLVFNQDTKSITAEVGGTFNTYQSGDIMVIEGTANNNGVYKVSSVSQDGKTIKLEPMEGTNPIADETFDVAANPDTVQFRSTFPEGAMISLDGMGEFGINDQGLQVTGISPDGTELYVKVNPSTFPTGTTNIPDSTRWSMSSEGYYEGGYLESEKYVSETQSITFDITAADPAFEKMFRALAEIAQGNFIDFRPLDEPMIGTKDASTTEQRVNAAFDLIDEAMFDPSNNTDINNADFYSIQSKINSNIIILNAVEDNQTAVKLNLENNISSLKNVNQEEAATKALLATNQLEASYAVMQNAMSVTLLDYLR